MNHVATNTLKEQNDGDYPQLSGATAKAYQARFFELRKMVDASPDAFFRAAAPLPCALPDEVKQQLVLDGSIAMFQTEIAKVGFTWEVENFDFALLEGDCKGGKLNGLATYVGSATITSLDADGSGTKKSRRRRTTGNLVDGRLIGKAESVTLETRTSFLFGVVSRTGIEASDSFSRSAMVMCRFQDFDATKLTGPNLNISYQLGAPFPFTTTAVIEPLGTGRVGRSSMYTGSHLQSTSHFLNDGTGKNHGPMVGYKPNSDEVSMTLCYQNGELVKRAVCPID